MLSDQPTLRVWPRLHVQGPPAATQWPSTGKRENLPWEGCATLPRALYLQNWHSCDVLYTSRTHLPRAIYLQYYVTVQRALYLRDWHNCYVLNTSRTMPRALYLQYCATGATCSTPTGVLQLLRALYFQVTSATCSIPPGDTFATCFTPPGLTFATCSIPLGL